MDQSSSSLENVKQIKCSIHKFQPLDLIDLTGNSKSGRTCIVCNQKNNIPHEQYSSIYELFEEEQEILSSYPPFKSKDIRDLIQKYCSKNLSKSKIDSFFHKLREDIETVIQEAENRAKQEIIKNENSIQKLRNEINKIAEKDKLKQLLVSGSCEDLNKFLQEKWNSSEQNEKQIQTCIKQIQDLRQKEMNCLIQSLQQLSLFDPPVNYIGNAINCVPSQNWNDSKQNLQIQKQGDEIVITNNSLSSGQRQCYLQQVLDPNKRYVIQLEINNTFNANPYFYIGLIDENNKDNLNLNSNNIHYYENANSGSGTICKTIKGYPVQSQPNQKQIGKKKLEFRIHLNEHVVKVSSQNYSCIAQQKCDSFIDISKKYYFAIQIYYPGDSVTILKVEEVFSFNSNM